MKAQGLNTVKRTETSYETDGMKSVSRQKIRSTV
jgi:hypothetical protein